MRLGELLVQDKLLSREALEEALESQVVHGGRLGTNLLELGLLSEADLAKALGKLHQVAFASGVMTPDPRALGLVELAFADDKDVLPMRVDQTRISVACINPHDLATMDAIGFRTGKRVVPVVIPEFRMNQLLRKHCKAFRPLRAIDMETVRPSRTLAAKTEKAPSADLMSEDEFQSLYAKVLSGETEAAEPQGASAEDEAVLEGVLLEEPEVEAAAASGRAPAPLPVPAPHPVPAAVPVAAPVPAPTTLAGQAPAARPVAAPMPVPAPAPAPVAAAPVAARPPEPPPTPLSFADAQKALSQSEDREDVAKTVLRFALGKWNRSLLLNVQGPLVTGWHGVGQGIRDKAIRRIAVALRGQSSFKLVCDTRSHFIGPLRRDAGTAVFYKMLGGDYPTTAVMLPLLVRGRVVHILYVDNGPGQVTPPDIGELLILGQSVARSYDALIRRRKSA